MRRGSCSRSSASTTPRPPCWSPAPTSSARRHLPAILDGEIWVQGFSEPEAGSDLASLRTTARRDGDGYVVNGQKLWASGGKHADWCLLLARTDPEAPKRKGISYFLLDMATPGVEVRPIRNAIGDSHFCEIFLNDVRIPAANLVGAENSGWQVAQATLGAERGMTMLELAERLGNAGFRWLVQSCPTDDPIVADRLAQFEIEITGLRGLCRQLVENTEAGTAGPADASIVKLYYSELLQRMTDFGAEIGGLPAHTELVKSASSGWESGSWVLDFIGSWEWTIPGGSSEIQRTIIAERGLGTAARAERGLMAHEFEEFHAELRSVAGDLLAKDRSVDWQALVDAGWVGLEVPEEFGGAGATFAEVAVICEEMGRAASANSYLGSAVLAVGTLNALQPSDTRDRASGRCRVGRRSGWPSRSNRPEFVPDAEGADRVLLVDRWGRRLRSRDRDTAAGARRDPPAGDGVRRRVDDAGDVCGSMAIPTDARSRLLRARRGRDRLRQPRPVRGNAVRDGVLREGAPPVRPRRSGRSRRSNTPVPTWS